MYIVCNHIQNSSTELFNINKYTLLYEILVDTVLLIKHYYDKIFVKCFMNFTMKKYK